MRFVWTILSVLLLASAIDAGGYGYVGGYRYSPTYYHGFSYYNSGYYGGSYYPSGWYGSYCYGHGGGVAAPQLVPANPPAGVQAPVMQGATPPAAAASAGGGLTAEEVALIRKMIQELNRRANAEGRGEPKP